MHACGTGQECVTAYAWVYGSRFIMDAPGIIGGWLNEREDEYIGGGAAPAAGAVWQKQDTKRGGAHGHQR
jgi:hypothetical protein